jgi:putative ABC transport system substrate-binding protein
LKEIIPKLSRVAVFGTSTQPGNAQMLRVELAAGAFKSQLQYLDVQSSKDIETAFRAAGKGRADAVLFLVAGGIASARRKEIVDLAIKSRLPAIYNARQYADAGGLMTYGASFLDFDRRALHTWTRSSKAPNPLTCQLNSRPSSSSSSI